MGVGCGGLWWGLGRLFFLLFLFFISIPSPRVGPRKVIPPFFLSRIWTFERRGRMEEGRTDGEMERKPSPHPEVYCFLFDFSGLLAHIAGRVLLACWVANGKKENKEEKRRHKKKP